MLITSWPLLRTWLEEDRAGLLLHRRLSQTCDDWVRHQRDVSFLYGGSRLLEAQRYAALHAQDISEDETEFLAASAARELVRERSRYLGQAAGGALGAAFGYGIALALGDWSRTSFSFERNTVLSALITFLVIFPTGELIGFAIGLGLWQWRHQPTQRLIATTLIGALTGSLTYSLYFIIRSTSGLPISFDRIMLGLLFGMALGISFGLPYTGWRRVGLTTLSTFIAALLFLVLSGVVGIPCTTSDSLRCITLNWSPWITILLSVVIGSFTSLGFLVAAVDNPERLIE